MAAGERFDVVVSNHVLHHLGDTERDAFLRDSAALAVSRSVHSDIRRSAAAYRLYAVGSVLVTAGTFIREDGLRSIRRSFTVPEARRRPATRVARRAGVPAPGPRGQRLTPRCGETGTPTAAAAP